jgi:SAM-dependent methyltransferase
MPHRSNPAMTACVACAGQGIRPLYRVSNFEIVACTSCGLARTSLPADFDPTTIYDESYFAGGQADGYVDYQGSQEILRKEFRRTVGVLARSGVSGGALIELGCAYGYFLEEARAAFSVCGVEVSAAASAACRARGLRVESTLSPELVADRGPFDAAVMLDVIEHLGDPASVLTELRRAMRTGGRLLLTTGDIGALSARLAGRRWRLLTPPQHLWFFSPETLTKLLERTGFRTLKVAHPWKVVPLSLIAFQGLRLLGVRIPSGMPQLPGGIPVNLFDAMRVIAEAA